LLNNKTDKTQIGEITKTKGAVSKAASFYFRIMQKVQKGCWDLIFSTL
jgi:hypothetical protein